MKTPLKMRLRAALPWVLGGGLAAAVILLGLPVALGVGAALVLDPLVRRVQRKTGMGRTGSAAVCVGAAFLLTVLAAAGLGSWAVKAAGALYGRLPAILQALSGWAAALSRQAELLAEELPGGVGDALRAWSGDLMSAGGGLAERVYEGVFSLASGFIAALPGGVLFGMTAALSCCFASAELPRLRELFWSAIPGKYRLQLRRLWTGVRTAMGRWFRAQLQLMGVTFLIVSAGLTLLRVEGAAGLGLGVAALDALPVFGTGTVLLPWALIAMMTGRFAFGLGLLAIYAAAALTRSVLEPRLLGAQLGLSPLLTLLALWTGWRLGGVLGMVLLPLAVMTAAAIRRGAKNEETAVNFEAGTEIS